MWKQMALSTLLWMGCTMAWAEELRKIYVAEPRGVGLSQGTLMAVSDQIRQGANDILASDEYDVMTRENMIMYLRENNKDCSDLDTDCHIQLGGAVDAQYIVHGNVTKTGDGVFIATIKLYTVSNGRMLSMTTVRSPKESELLTLMRKQSQTLFQTGLKVSSTNPQATEPASEQVLVLRSSSDFAPSDELERMIWEEQRRQELEQQFAQIRREATEQRQKEATVMWKRIQPLLSSPSRQKLLNKFIEQYEQSKVVVEYISPDTGETTQSRLTVPIPETFEARQLLFANRSLYKAKLIPAGSFLMGCTEEQGADCDDDEQPMHTVTLSKDFYMMESEVTQGLYQRVMGNNPSEFKGNNRPVEKVSWFDAVKFANKLSSMEGLEECYSINGNTVTWSKKECAGWRLPTEAEWEYSARGGQSYKYAGSNSVGDVAWYRENSVVSGKKQTHDVCGKNRNGYGLCDMSGNVWEWVWDWHGSYSGSPTVDPRGPTSGSYRVVRGGGWGNNAQGVRVSYRNNNDPTDAYSFLGFRLARNSP